jgi:hypothetical protein
MNQMKGLPANIKLLTFERECLKFGPVKKQKRGRSSEKERLFYLFSDILVYCTAAHQYKGIMNCSKITFKDLSENSNQFELSVEIERNSTGIIRSSSFSSFSDNTSTYTITCESQVEKQDWLQKLETA